MALRTGVFTAGAAGFLTHEVGGVEANISTITTDNFLVGTSAGVIGVRTAAQARTHLSLVVGTDVQAEDPVLTDLAALSAVADNEFIVGTGAGTYAHESGATVRTSIGLGTGDAAAFDSLTLTTDLAVAEGGTGASDAATARSNLSAQAQDAVLDDLTALSAVADNEFIVGTGAGTYAHESGTTVRTSIGLGTGDTPQFTGIEVGAATDTTLTRASAGNLNVEGNLIYRAGGTDVPLTDGGTGSSTASGAFTNIKQTATETATGVAEIATQAETDAGTDDVRYVTPLKIASMTGNLPAPDFESSEQTVTLDTLLNVAHSLGAKPTLVQVFLRCTTADLNYSIGDEVFMVGFGAIRATSDEGMSMFTDTTNVSLVQGAQISLLSKTSFNGNIIVVTSWRWIVRAWK